MPTLFLTLRMPAFCRHSKYSPVMAPLHPEQGILFIVFNPGIMQLEVSDSMDSMVVNGSS